MTIAELQRAYVAEASRLGDYTAISKLDLANGYCDAEESGDELLRSAYWAALMLRYWYKIYEWIKNSASCKLQPEDFVDWLNDSLNIAFYYRSWRWEYEAVVRFGRFIEWKKDDNGNRIINLHYYKVDPNAADRSINYFCATWRGREYQALNKDKRKAGVLNNSLDEAVETVGDGALEDNNAISEAETSTSIKDLIHAFLKESRLIESLVLDGIAYQDSFKEIKHKRDISDEVSTDGEDGETGLPFKPAKYTYEHVFDKRKLIHHLSTIDESFMEYFSSMYEIDDNTCIEIFKKLKSLNNMKLYRYVDKTLDNLRKDPNLLAHIAF